MLLKATEHLQKCGLLGLVHFQEWDHMMGSIKSSSTQNHYVITEIVLIIIMEVSITELVARLQEEWREKILRDKEATQVTQLRRKYKKH